MPDYVVRLRVNYYAEIEVLVEDTEDPFTAEQEAKDRVIDQPDDFVDEYRLRMDTPTVINCWLDSE
jgi:hypothetical protein